MPIRAAARNAQRAASRRVRSIEHQIARRYHSTEWQQRYRRLLLRLGLITRHPVPRHFAVALYRKLEHRVKYRRDATLLAAQRRPGQNPEIVLPPQLTGDCEDLNLVLFAGTLLYAYPELQPHVHSTWYPNQRRPRHVYTTISWPGRPHQHFDLTAYRLGPDGIPDTTRGDHRPWPTTTVLTSTTAMTISATPRRELFTTRKRLPIKTASSYDSETTLDI